MSACFREVDALSLVVGLLDPLIEDGRNLCAGSLVLGNSREVAEFVRIGLEVVELFAGSLLLKELRLCGIQLALRVKLPHRWIACDGPQS